MEERLNIADCLNDNFFTYTGYTATLKISGITKKAYELCLQTIENHMAEVKTELQKYRFPNALISLCIGYLSYNNHFKQKQEKARAQIMGYELINKQFFTGKSKEQIANICCSYLSDSKITFVSADSLQKTKQQKAIQAADHDSTHYAETRPTL